MTRLKACVLQDGLLTPANTSGEEHPLPFSIGVDVTLRRSLDHSITDAAGRSQALREGEGSGHSAQSDQGVLPYETEAELREAAKNFKAYLDILREWDRREKPHPRRRSRTIDGHDRDC